MCNNVKKLVAITLPLLLTAFLSGCGGASGDEPSANPSSAINKPDQQESSANSSSAQSSVVQPAASSIAYSSSTPVMSSSSHQSSTETYTRASRSSTSAAASSSPPASIEDSDTTPPTTPMLRLNKLSATSITLQWDHASDNVGVEAYEIERDGISIAILEFPTYAWSDTNLKSYTDYTYTIRALDFAGNPSAKSQPFRERTLAAVNSGASSKSSSSKSSSSKSSGSKSDSSKSSSSKSSSSKSADSTSTSSKSSNSSNSSAPQKVITISWLHPDKREGGQFLELHEIGGYELRFKTNSSSQYTYFTLHGNTTTTYSTNLIPDDSAIQIAVFDTDGLYSDFIDISPAN